jgi:hypothetical protein
MLLAEPFSRDSVPNLFQWGLTSVSASTSEPLQLLAARHTKASRFRTFRKMSRALMILAFVCVLAVVNAFGKLEYRLVPVLFCVFHARKE